MKTEEPTTDKNTLKVWIPIVCFFFTVKTHATSVKASCRVLYMHIHIFFLLKDWDFPLLILPSVLGHSYMLF